MTLHMHTSIVVYCKGFAICLHRFYADNGFGEYILADGDLINFFQSSSYYVV